MGQACTIIPKVKSKKSGEIVESKLFKDLLSFTSYNREDTVGTYLMTKSNDFIQEIGPKVTMDENDEPTLRSLLKVMDLDKIISDSKVLETLNRKIGHYKKGTTEPMLVEDNSENYKDLAKQAIDFNSTSDYNDEYVALVTRSTDKDTNSMLGIEVVKRTAENADKANKMEVNELLNNRLMQILEEHGVKVGTLTELEERLGVNGVTDFNVAKRAADGLVEMIRLAAGVKGKQALPEEFAHWVLEALGEHPLVARLLNMIDSHNMASEIIGEEYERYYDEYDGDIDRLNREAAGKLLAKHLLQGETIPSKPYKNLLQRLIQAIKNFLSKFSTSSIERAKLDADKQFGYLAQQILNGNMDDAIDIDKIRAKDSLFALTEKQVEMDKKALKTAINTELKKLKLYSTKYPGSDYNINQEIFIEKLEHDLAANNEIEGIYSYVEEALKQLNLVQDRLKIMASTPMNLNEKAQTLREIRNYYFSYSNVLDTIRKAMLNDQKNDSDRYARVKDVLKELDHLMENVYSNYQDVAMPLFVSFIKPFFGESITVPFGKYKGKVLKVEELVKVADRDISFFDRWLDSMADSSDYMLKLFDQAVKKSKENARLDTIEVQKQIEAATIKLEQAGYKNAEWMFEVDDEGNKTGNYISEINQGLFKKKVAEMYKRLEKKYGKNPTGENAIKFIQERDAWYNENTEIINDEFGMGTRIPKRSIYENKFFTGLSDTDPRKVYYNTIMGIKEKLDLMLPTNYTHLLNTIKIRKDLIERVKASDGVRSGASEIWESIKDQFIRRCDDTDFGSKAAIKDFEGREVQTLPIYYTKMKDGESANDISTDVASTMVAYAAMANEFHQMNKIIDCLELGRDLMRERSIAETSGDKPLTEKFKILGRKLESKLTKSGDETRFMQRLNDFFEMQVYHRYMADEGTFGNSRIDKAKTVNFLGRITSLNSLALNVLAGISNVATGSVMMRIESLAGEYFTEGNTLRADKNYAAAMPAFMAEIGKRVKTSKLALWDELFDVLQDYDEEKRDSNFSRKSRFGRMCNSSTLFFTNNCGEHWMQNRTSLALADAYKMKGPEGKIVSLWDAMEVVYIDEKNKALGAKLQLKKGYTKADGSAFTRDDLIAFSRKSAAINQRMHGIYNQADKNAIQKTSIGRLGIMFRKWIKPSLNRRFKSVTYNFDMQEWTEGYYNTTGRFLLQMAKDLKEGKFAIAANWKNLDKTEKANIRRAATEVGHFLLLALILGLIDWPDDKDRPWLVAMAEYQARRLYTELGSMIPGKPMVNEGLKIIKSPAAAVNTFEDMLNIVGILNPWNYELVGGEDAILQSGRFKGENRATKLLYESPLIPMNRTIYRAINPDDAMAFFKN